MNYTFLDAYASVQSAESSVALSGQRQVVTIGSVLQALPVIAMGNASISGTIGASVIGLTPVAVVNTPSISGTVNIGNFPTNPSVSGTIIATQGTSPWVINGSVSGQVGASVIGTVPVTQVGAWSASFVGVIPGSTVAFQGTSPWVVNFQNSSILAVPVGSVIAYLQAPSIVGTYAEDAAHTTADKGLFILGVRNDTVSSFVGANTEYSALATDSAGRTLIKPFAPDQAAIRGMASNVGTSVTALLPAAGTGLRHYITDLIAINTGAATAAVNIRDADASILTRIIVPTGGGSNIPGLATPLRTGGLNSHVDMVPLTPSSMITITALGYIAP